MDPFSTNYVPQEEQSVCQEAALLWVDIEIVVWQSL